MFFGRTRKACRRSSFSLAAIAEGGVGGALGMKGAGMVAAVEITAAEFAESAFVQDSPGLILDGLTV